MIGTMAVTVLDRLTPLTSPKPRPRRASSQSRSTAYSSGIRRASVSSRQVAHNCSPSNVPSLTFVLPMSIARSKPATGTSVTSPVTFSGSGALRPPPPVVAPLVPRSALLPAASPRLTAGGLVLLLHRLCPWHRWDVESPEGTISGGGSSCYVLTIGGGFLTAFKKPSVQADVRCELGVERCSQ